MYPAMGVALYRRGVMDKGLHPSANFGIFIVHRQMMVMIREANHSDQPIYRLVSEPIPNLAVIITPT